jgi:hypothetical protein
MRGIGPFARGFTEASPNSEHPLVQDEVVSSPDQRVDDAINQARLLGYTLFLEELPGVTSRRYVARAVPNAGHEEIRGQFLAVGTSEAGAAEGGLEVLRRVLYRGDPWPREGEIA